MIVHREKAALQGRKLTEKLKQIIPRQLFEVPIQAAIGGRCAAREPGGGLGRAALGRGEGGDSTRKGKLVGKQKGGKRRMKRVGAVEIPQDAFMAVLSLD